MFYPASKFRKTFIIEREQTVINDRGGSSLAWMPAASFVGYIANAQPGQEFREGQAAYPVTHTVTHPGPPVALQEDRLVVGGTTLVIHKVKDLAKTGLWTVYECEERTVA